MSERVVFTLGERYVEAHTRSLTLALLFWSHPTTNRYTIRTSTQAPKALLLAIHLLFLSKKGYSVYQLHRNLGVIYQSAWFMAHRLRFSMTQEPWDSKLGGIVEAGETYIGGKAKNMRADERAKKVDGRGVVSQAPIEGFGIPAPA